MAELGTFCQVLLTIAAAVVTLGGAQAVLDRWSRPARETTSLVAEHERRLDDGDEGMRSLAEGQRMANRCMLQLLNHLIDGNHVEQLKSERDALEMYLIEK